MREIKFRVWCEYEIEGQLHKEMCGPENWFLLTQTGHLMSHGPMSFNPNAEKDYKVIIPEFFTGLKDKNGKEIYEGDIIFFNNLTKKDVFIVEWGNIESAFVVTMSKDIKWRHRLGKFRLEYIEVIGNIHENPELLK